MIGVTGTSGKTTTRYLSRRASPRPAHHRADRHRRDPDRRRAAAQRVDHPGGPGPAGAVRGDARARGHARGDGGVQPRAGARPGRRAPRFAVGAFTNLSQDHLDFHHDMDEYFAAKAMLFDGRARARGRHASTTSGARGSPPACRRAVTVATDRRDRRLARRRRRHRPPTARQHFTALGPDGPVPVAAAAARLVQRGQRAARARVPGTRSACAARPPREPVAEVAVPGRMERVDVRPGRSWPWSTTRTSRPRVAAVLDALRAQVPGRLIVGAGLRRRPGPRQAAADGRGRRAARRRADRHRRQPALARTRPTIRAAMLAGRAGVPGTAASCARSATGGRRSSRRSHAARPGDAVVIAGKGHETGQEIGGVRAPVRRRGRARRRYQRCSAGALGAPVDDRRMIGCARDRR